MAVTKTRLLYFNDPIDRSTKTTMNTFPRRPSLTYTNGKTQQQQLSTLPGEIINRVSVDCGFSPTARSAANTCQNILVMNDHLAIFQEMNSFQRLICTRLLINDPNLRLTLFVDPSSTGVSDVQDIRPDEKDDSSLPPKERNDGLRGVETIEEFNHLVVSFQKHISGMRDGVLKQIFNTVANDLRNNTPQHQQNGLLKLHELVSLGKGEVFPTSHHG